MKKITIKIAAFLFFTLAVLQVNAQSIDGDGLYRIKVTNGPNPGLYLTVQNTTPLEPGSAVGTNLVYSALDASSNAQVFEIIFNPESVNAAGDQDGRFFIQSTVEGIGGLEILDTTNEASPLGFRNNLDGDVANRLDEWFIRGNIDNGQRIFSQHGPVFTGSARKRIGTSGIEAGAPAKISGGSDANFEFETATLSTPEAFATASLKAFPNPSSNGVFNLSVETAYTVYSVLGKQVLKGSGTSVDLSGLSKGLYILKTDAGQTIRLIF